MVKIGEGYINPQHVLAVSPSADGVRVDLGPGVYSYITGASVDEVHDKLFPEAKAEVTPLRIIQSESEALVALEYVIQTAKAGEVAAIPERIAYVACKALGREGT